MKKPTLKPELLTDEQRDKLDAYNAQQKQLTILQDIADMTQDMLMEGDKEKKFTQKAVEDFGALLVDMRESLDALNNREDLEAPDYAKPVVEAVAKLEKALKAINVKPEVKVLAPDVNVPAPDLKPLTELIKKEIPKSFEQAIKLIPKFEMPEADNSELLKAWEGISEQLVSIENATRLKPLPGSMSISNLDEVSNLLEKTTYKVLVDKSTTTDVIYIGKALPGTGTNVSAWAITKVDKTVTDNVTITNANGGEFNNKWDNRAAATTTYL